MVSAWNLWRQLSNCAQIGKEFDDKLKILEENVDVKIATVVEQTAQGVLALLGHQVSLHHGKTDEHQVTLDDIVKKCEILERTMRRDVVDRCDTMCFRLFELEQGMEHFSDQLEKTETIEQQIPKCVEDALLPKLKKAFDALQKYFESWFDDFKTSIDDELMSLASYVDDQISTSDESARVHAPKPRKKTKR